MDQQQYYANPSFITQNEDGPFVQQQDNGYPGITSINDFGQPSYFLGFDQEMADGTNTSSSVLQTQVITRGIKRSAEDANLSDFAAQGLHGSGPDMEPAHPAQPAQPTKVRKVAEQKPKRVTKKKQARKDQGPWMAPSGDVVKQAEASCAVAEAAGGKQGLWGPVKMNFGPTSELLTLHLVDGTPLKPKISASSEWELPLAGRIGKLIIYRRNYMTFKVSFEISPHVEGAKVYAELPGGHRRQVLCFGTRINAVVADATLEPVRLIKNTTKRDKGPLHDVSFVATAPRIPSPAQEQGPTNTAPTPAGNFELPNSVDDNNRPAPWDQTFSRLQFTQATLNNGRHNQPQQYFYIRAELWAVLETAGGGERDSVCVADTYSEKMLVRGRSPGHYMEQDNEAVYTYILDAIDKGVGENVAPAGLQSKAIEWRRLQMLQETDPPADNASIGEATEHGGESELNPFELLQQDGIDVSQNDITHVSGRYDHDHNSYIGAYTTMQPMQATYNGGGLPLHYTFNGQAIGGMVPTFTVHGYDPLPDPHNPFCSARAQAQDESEWVGAEGMARGFRDRTHIVQQELDFGHEPEEFEEDDLTDEDNFQQLQGYQEEPSYGQELPH